MEKLLRHKIHLLTQQPGTCSSSKFSELQRQMIAVTFSIRHQRCIPVSVIVPFWEIHNFWQLKINNVLSNKQLTPAAVWLITSRLLKRRRQVLIGKKKNNEEPMEKQLQHCFCLPWTDPKERRWGDVRALTILEGLDSFFREMMFRGARGWGDSGDEEALFFLAHN